MSTRMSEAEGVDVTAVCTTCRKRQPAPQHVRCKRCCDAQRIRNKRYRDKQKLLRLPRRRPDRLVIRGETRIERCYREACEAVGRAIRYPPTAAALETVNHGRYLRYRRAVHAEYMRRLKAAGVYVEGA